MIETSNRIAIALGLLRQPYTVLEFFILESNAMMAAWLKYGDFILFNKIFYLPRVLINTLLDPYVPKKTPLLLF